MERLIREAGDPALEPRAEHVEGVRSLLLDRLDPPGPACRRTRPLVVGSGLAALAVVAVSLAIAFLRPNDA